jgi:hypothetical protein
MKIQEGNSEELRDCQLLKKDNIAGKVVPLLFLTDHHAMKAYCGVEL